MYLKNKPTTGNVFKTLLTNYYISLETAVIRRTALDNLTEWFDNRFNMVEESDLFTRIAHDWHLDYVDKILAKWRIHGANWSYQKKDLAIQEKQQLLEKLCELYPNFENDFKNEIQIIKSQIDFRAAKLDWENNKKTEARVRLKPYFKSSNRHKLIFLMTFFPYSFYKKLYKIKGMEPL